MSRAVLLTQVSLATLLAGSCLLSDDVTDFDFKLPDKTFELQASDLGLSTQTDVACSQQQDPCSSISDALTCDKSEGVCVLASDATFPAVDCSQEDHCQSFGEFVSCVQGTCRLDYQVELAAQVNLAQEVPELKDVGSSRLTKVTIGALWADVQTNTLGVDLPPLDIYAVDTGVQSLDFDEAGNVTTPNAVLIGTLPSIGANKTGHFDVTMTEAGKEHLTERLATPNVPFQFFVVAHFTLEGNDPLPNLDSGAIRVTVSGTATASLSSP